MILSYKFILDESIITWKFSTNSQHTLIVALNTILFHFMNHLSVNGLEGQEFDSMCRTTQPNFMNFIFFLQQLQLNNFDWETLHLKMNLNHLEPVL